MQLHRIFGAAALTLVAGLAQAVPVTFTFGSVVTATDPTGPVDPALAVGSPIKVSVTFDSDAALVQTRNDASGNPLRRELLQAAVAHPDRLC